jgi:SAM-dependent methyltransferase
MTIFDLFETLDRCAPGDARSIARICDGLAPGARILDAGCGRGADLPALLALPGARVVALDAAEPFVAHVRATYPGVAAVCGDMANPPGGPFDLIWSGGAIYNLGVTLTLLAWRRHLAPGGRVAFSDLVLRGDFPSARTQAFFVAEGVGLRTEAAVHAEIATAGFRCTDSFWLPHSAWEDYYLPLERRLSAMTQNDPETAELVRGFHSEIDLWRQHGTEYGYLVCLTVPA